MKKEAQENFTNDLSHVKNIPHPFLVKSIENTSKDLEKLSAQEQLQWGYEQFDEKFVLTTSFGIQSAVLLSVKLPSINKGSLFVINYFFLILLKYLTIILSI